MILQTKVQLLEPLARIAAERQAREKKNSNANESPARLERIQRHLTTNLNSTRIDPDAESNWWQLVHYSNLAKWPTFNEYSQLIVDNSNQYTNFWFNHNNSTSQPLSLLNNQNISDWTRNLMAKLAAAGNARLIFSRHSENDQNSKIATNWDRLAQLSCDSGEMILRLNFTEPFRGIVYPDHNRLSPCRFFGDGHHNFELRLPLKGCGTRQVAQRVFVNDVIVRFHKSLELEEDEVKTLICRYPPPLAPTNALHSGPFGGSPGNGLLHELDGRQINSHGESASSQQQQPIEFVDPVTGHVRAGNFAFDSLAPSGGAQRNQPIRLAPNLSLRPAGEIVTADDVLRRPPIGLSGDELINGSTSQLLPTGAGSASYFDRLTSLDLLFLISALMFLVLLVFGLTAGYFCLSSQRRRRLMSRQRPVVPKVLYPGARSAHQSRFAADAILRKHNEALRPTVQPNRLSSSSWRRSGGPSAATLGLAHHNQSVRQHFPATQQTYQQYSSTGHQLRGDLSRIALCSTSPDDATSDVSARVLLPTDGAYSHSLARLEKPGVVGRRGLDGNQSVYAGHPHQSTLGRRHQNLQFHGLKAGASTREPLLRQDEVFSLAQQQDPSSGVSQLRSTQSMQRLNDAYVADNWLQRSNQPMKVRQWQSNLFDESSGPPLAPAGARLLKRRERHDYDPSDRTELPDAPLGSGEQNRKPRLVLKSIDDTFITSVTEVHEQEYMKYDNMTRPLSWLDWAAASNAAKRAQADLSSASGDDDKDAEGSGFQQANLRSLTELDVNFAKSLQRNRSEPDDSKRRSDESGPKSHRSPTEGGENEDDASVEISPEYDCPTATPDREEPGPGTGVKLRRGPSPSANSHGSISYV